MELKELLFLLISAATVISAMIVAFSKKIVHSAFALLATLSGFAAFYVYLSADFMAVAQIMIYVGGILILILFGVLLTHRIYDTARKSAHNSFWLSMLGGVLFLAVLALVIFKSPWAAQIYKGFSATTTAIGTNILTTYLLPFEVVSVLLLGALLGAVYIGRMEDRKK